MMLLTTSSMPENKLVVLKLENFIVVDTEDNLINLQ